MGPKPVWIGRRPEHPTQVTGSMKRSVLAPTVIFGNVILFAPYNYLEMVVGIGASGAHEPDERRPGLAS
jgi:hypothetical protein